VTGRLDGQVVFITGAARGQGRADAVLLASEGASVIGVDVVEQVATIPYPTATGADMDETVRLVEAAGGSMAAFEADVRDLTALTHAVESGVAQFGRLDAVVANAGVCSTCPTLELSEESWSTVIDINLTGVWKTLKASVPAILESGRGGSVVIISSLAAMKASESTAHYTASKTGQVGLMRVLAKELAPQKVRVNSIHPTTVMTEMVLNDSIYRLFRPDLESPTREDFEEASRDINALPVAGIDSIDVANAVLYLIADSGRYVTGSTMVVDAGGSL